MIKRKQVQIYFFILNVLCISLCNVQAFETVQLSNVIETNGINYIECSDIITFNFSRFPLTVWPELQPASGMLNKTFIMTIQNGQVYSSGNVLGLIMADKSFIEEFIWPSKARFIKRHPKFKQPELALPFMVAGKLAVIAQEGKAYAHWMLETLGRLALLEMHNIEYDFLYAPIDKQFKKETLQLWGIEGSKILEPLDSTSYIQAEELIVPSLISRTLPALDENPLFCLYAQPEVTQYVRNKFLSLPELEAVDYSKLSKKVFISRKDTSIRQMINEDEVFEHLKAYGFTRYTLSEMSFLQQVALFSNADTIIGAHGSGLTNILFCRPGTKIIEIFQTRGDCTFWYLSQMLNLQHICIKTVDFGRTNGPTNTFLSPLALTEILQHLML